MASIVEHNSVLYGQWAMGIDIEPPFHVSADSAPRPGIDENQPTVGSKSNSDY